MQNVPHYLALAWAWACAHQTAILAVVAAALPVLRATVLTDARWAALEAHHPRVTATVRLLRALFPDLWKAAKALYPILTGRPWTLGDEPPKLRDTDPAPPRGAPGDRPTVVPPLPVLLFALALAGCAGSQTGINGGFTMGPDGSWTVGVGVTISIARAALPPVDAIVQSRQDVPAATRADVHRALTVAGDALGEAEIALQTYKQAPSVAAQCRVRFAVDRSLAAAIQGVQLARDAGAAMDQSVQAALGGLGALLDTLWPGCADAGVSSAQERVRRMR